MPEASVDEDGKASLEVSQIRRSWKRADVRPVADPKGTQGLSHLQFGRCSSSAYRSHPSRRCLGHLGHVLTIPPARVRVSVAQEIRRLSGEAISVVFWTLAEARIDQVYSGEDLVRRPTPPGPPDQPTAEGTQGSHPRGNYRQRRGASSRARRRTRFSSSARRAASCDGSSCLRSALASTAADSALEYAAREDFIDPGGIRSIAERGTIARTQREGHELTQRSTITRTPLSSATVSSRRAVSITAFRRIPSPPLPGVIRNFCRARRRLTSAPFR